MPGPRTETASARSGESGLPRDAERLSGRSPRAAEGRSAGCRRLYCRCARAACIRPRELLHVERRQRVHRVAGQETRIGRPVCLRVRRVLPLVRCAPPAADARFVSESRSSPAAGPKSDRFVMMYHGTLTRTYGVDIAVEAFGMAHKEMPGAELWILGSGPEEDVLRRLIRQHALERQAKLVGSVPSAEVCGWLRQGDAGVRC